MNDPILQVSRLGKRFGGFVALEEIDLDVARGERLGLIGPNGSGKSTLVNCLCGTLRNETGRVVFDGRRMDGLTAHERTRLGMARSFQLPRPFATMTLAENLRVPILYATGGRGAEATGGRGAEATGGRGAEATGGRGAAATGGRGAAATGGRGAAATGGWGADGGIEARCRDLLDLVGLAGKAQHRPPDLTQIEMRKLELARAMAAGPRLLIADEAMAGLSHQEVDDILALLLRLNEQGVTIIMIEHIMRAVLAFSQRLVVLVAGRKIADGDPQAVVRQPDVVEAYLGS